MLLHSCACPCAMAKSSRGVCGRQQGSAHAGTWAMVTQVRQPEGCPCCSQLLSRALVSPSKLWLAQSMTYAGPAMTDSLADLPCPAGKALPAERKLPLSLCLLTWAEVADRGLPSRCQSAAHLQAVTVQTRCAWQAQPDTAVSHLVLHRGAALSRLPGWARPVAMV
jgi:hypothetical protein